MVLDFADIVRCFAFEGDFLRAYPYGSGHINDTYAAEFRKDDGVAHRYLLQRINHDVFKNPEQLMHNIERVIRHLREKIRAAGGNPQREAMCLIPTIDGGTYCRMDSGDYWRGFVLIEGAQTYEIAESMKHVYCAARAFGSFQGLLSDFPAGHLHETIPGFHNTPQRFQAFVEAVERDTANRAHAVRREIAFVEQRAGETSVLIDLLDQGLLPERVTHNDTKFNNVMIDDETGEAVCVIDLDTVMPGSALYDFGDSVRAAANSAAEDEPDLSKVAFRLDIFEHLAAGYLDSTRDFLTPAERDYLAFSAKLMTFECGMRFLADHLNGDTYFKVHREGHNLDRCRTQFKMVQDMEAQYDQMMRIVELYW
jgi:Ser/Thr protein kinase RdoA (MazF antagonist)